MPQQQPTLGLSLQKLGGFPARRPSALEAEGKLMPLGKSIGHSEVSLEEEKALHTPYNTDTKPRETSL